MKKNIGKILAGWVRRVRLVDRFLLIFMFILLIHSTHRLFSHEMLKDDSRQIDIALRTTMASIFGYFIGGLFVEAGKNSQGEENTTAIPPKVSQPTEAQPLAPKAQIGFRMEGEGTEETQVVSGSVLEKVRQSEQQERQRSKYLRQQIYIVSTIGIFSLVVLIIVNGMNPLTASAAPGVTQLRDFVSGSVGLLIGHSSKERL